MLKKYIRDESKKPFGILVALDREHIGLSICNNRDKWNKELGERLAIGNAFIKPYEIPHLYNIKRFNLIMDTSIKFVERVQRYFKEMVE